MSLFLWHRCRDRGGWGWLDGTFHIPHFGCGHSREFMYIEEHMWRSEGSLSYQSFLPSCLRQGLLMLLLLASTGVQGSLLHHWFCSRCAGIAGMYYLIQLFIGPEDWNPHPPHMHTLRYSPGLGVAILDGPFTGWISRSSCKLFIFSTWPESSGKQMP